MKIKKAYKWTLGVVLSPILLLLVTAVLLYLPPIQDYAIKVVTQYASEKTGYDIKAERVRLVFPLDLGINGVSVMKHGKSLTQTTDTIADINSLTVNIRLMPLLKKQVEIDKLDLQKTKINTDDFIVGTQVKGFVGQLTLESHGIDLGKETLRINHAKLNDAQIGVFLTDTTSQDTTKTETFWKINVDDLQVAKTKIDLHTAGDSLHIGTYLGAATAKQCFFDLHESVYEVGSFKLEQSKINYDNNFAAREKGLDVNHIELSDIAIGLDSLHYSNEGIALAIKNCEMKEKSGLHLTALSGNINMDSTKVVVPNLVLKTSESSMYADISMPFNILEMKSKDNARISVDASFGKQDIMRFLSGMSSDITKYYPNYPLTIKGVIAGNASRMNINKVLLSMPTAFKVSASGYATSITDTKRLGANIDLKAQTYNLDFIKHLAGIDAVSIPRGMTMLGNLRAKGDRYAAKISATVGKGTLKATADANMSTMAYKAQVKANSLPLNKILPGKGFKNFSGDVDIVGRGTNLYANSTKINLNTSIRDFGYDNYDLSDIVLTAEVKEKKANISLQSHNDLIDGNIDLTAMFKPNDVRATLDCDVVKADMYRLHVFDNPLTVAIKTNMDMATNMKNSHRLKGNIKNIYIKDSTRTYHPEDITLNILTHTDTSYVYVNSGDLDMKCTARCGYMKLMDNFGKSTKELKKQIDERYIDQLRLRQYLPELTVHIEAGKENFFQRAINRTGNAFRHTHIDMDTSPKNATE